MSNLKNKVTEGAEHVKSVVTETTAKIGRSAAEAFHKSDHVLTDAARKVNGLAVEAVDKLKRAAGGVPSAKTVARNVDKSN
jgi:hypothetical protein